MKILLILLLFPVICFPVKDKIAGYILNDVNAVVSYQWRLQYIEENNNPWSNHSKTSANIDFPRVK